ncbi:MAG: hypothetical protein KGK18_06365, partial [Burkholderiales bacterium]|nr:hypothetical protein [Burkholderiales bacterium]
MTGVRRQGLLTAAQCVEHPVRGHLDSTGTRRSPRDDLPEARNPQSEIHINRRRTCMLKKNKLFALARNAVLGATAMVALPAAMAA